MTVTRPQGFVEINDVTTASSRTITVTGTPSANIIPMTDDAGTLIPSISLVTGGVTPVVAVGSYFMAWCAGPAAAQTMGPWT